LSASEIFLNKPQAMSQRASPTCAVDGSGRIAAICGSISEARVIGPAMSCGKKPTKVM
jgi:hypothetical protein